MVRTQSLLLRNAIFGVAAAVFAGLLAFRSAATKASNDATGQGPAFPPLAVEKVQSVEFEQTTKVDGKAVKESVRLVRTGVAAWKLASSFDYGADTGKVESYLKSLSGAKRHAEPTSDANKFAQFAGTEGFLEVRVFENDSAPSLAFGVGKTSPDAYTKKFVRLDDAGSSKTARILLVSGLDAYGSPTSATNWVETRLLPALTGAEVAELSIEQGEAHRKVAFARGARTDAGDKNDKNGKHDGQDGKSGDDPWNMTSPTAEPALAEPVMSLVRGFVGLTFASIEAGSTTPADDVKFGFDKPDLVLTATGKPPVDPKHPPASWTVVIGKKVEGKSAWYARRSTGKTDDPYVFTVNDYDLTEFRKEPTTWLEKKPEPPAPATTPEAAMDGAAPAMDGASETPPAMTDAPVTPPAMDATPPAPAPEAPKTPDAPKDAPPTAPAPASDLPKVPETPKGPEVPKDAPPPK